MPRERTRSATKVETIANFEVGTNASMARVRKVARELKLVTAWAGFWRVSSYVQRNVHVGRRY